VQQHVQPLGAHRRLLERRELRLLERCQRHWQQQHVLRRPNL
jgi:hypothetical protein